MSATHAAVSEIVRVAWWSLRALGCPLGAVERMAKVMAFSEVLEGGCLEALRVDAARLTASFAAPEPRFERKSDDYGCVDAAGRTLLDVGPRTVDVLTGAAKSGRRTRIRVERAGDLLGLSGACVLAARRGVAVLAIRRSAARPGYLDWALYFDTPAGTQSVSGATDTSAGTEGIQRALQNLVAGDRVFPAIPRVSGAGSDEAPAAGHGVDLIGFVPGEMPALAPEGGPELRRTDVGAALHGAYAHGIDVATPDLKFLYQLETRTWAPSSERSRMQAGFGTPSPGPAS